MGTEMELAMLQMNLLPLIALLLKHLHVHMHKEFFKNIVNKNLKFPQWCQILYLRRVIIIIC